MATHAENFFHFLYFSWKMDNISKNFYKNNDNDRCIINMSDDNQRLFKVLDVFESKIKTHFRNLQIWGFYKVNKMEIYRFSCVWILR